MRQIEKVKQFRSKVGCGLREARDAVANNPNLSMEELLNKFRHGEASSALSSSQQASPTPAPKEAILQALTDQAQELDMGYGVPSSVAMADIIEHIAGGWDGCLYNGVGENIDIGSAIRAEGKRLTHLLQSSTTASSTALRPTDDELWDQTLKDRDTYHDWADRLTHAIAEHFGQDFGEHSNMNCPWAEAVEYMESLDPAPASSPQEASKQGELPPPFGFLCDWGNSSYGLTRQVFYYVEPGSASLDDWNESPKVHKNLPLYTEEQMREYALAFISASPSDADFDPSSTELIVAFMDELVKHPQTKLVIGREALILRCVRAAIDRMRDGKGGA